MDLLQKVPTCLRWVQIQRLRLKVQKRWLVVSTFACIYHHISNWSPMVNKKKLVVNFWSWRSYLFFWWEFSRLSTAIFLSDINIWGFRGHLVCLTNDDCDCWRKQMAADFFRSSSRTLDKFRFEKQMDANDKNSPLVLHLFNNNKKSYLYGCMLPECLIMLKIRAFHHLSCICNRYRT